MYKILIVDDSFENRQLLAEVLREVAICDFAASAKEAVEAYNLSIKQNMPYCLILLDIELPEMTGLDILTKIRESERVAGISLGDGIPVIIVTAYEKRFIEAYERGCDDYLLKPIDVNELMTKIAKVLEKASNR